MNLTRFLTHGCPPIAETCYLGNIGIIPLRLDSETQPWPIANRWSSDWWSNHYRSILRAGTTLIRDRCRAASAALHPRLWSVYGPSVKVTMIEPTSSIVVRSEHFFGENREDRMSLRLHCYELLHDGIGYTNCFRKKKTLPDVNDAERDVFLQELSDKGIIKDLFDPQYGLVGGQSLHPDDRFGHYLGFIDLRPNFGPTPKEKNKGAPLALGLLVPPRRYRLDPRSFIITGDYSAVFGGPPYSCTVYCQHDPHTSGAKCAQAALIMALSMLADRRARVEGSYALTFLAKGQIEGVQNRIEPGEPDECLYWKLVVGRDIHGWFDCDGLSPDECVNALAGSDSGRSRFRVSPCLVKLYSKEPIRQRLKKRNRDYDFTDRLSKRLIQAYVSAKLPIVLFVDPNHWWSRTRSKPGKKKKITGHAVTVIGIRRHGPDTLGRVIGMKDPFYLIVHDPGHEPFYEKSINSSLNAAWHYYASVRRKRVGSPDKDRLPLLRFLGIADELLKTHPSHCLDYLCGYSTLCTRDDLQDPVATDPIQIQRVKSFAPYASVSRKSGTNFRIRLIHSDELPTILRAEDVDDPNITGQLTFPPGRYWAVMGYRFTKPTSAGSLSDVWLFPAEESRIHEGMIAPHPSHVNIQPGKEAIVRGNTEIVLTAGKKFSRARPTLSTQQSAPPIKSSVITSCSSRALPVFINEVVGVNRLQRIDLYTFRETDLLSFKSWLETEARDSENSNKLFTLLTNIPNCFDSTTGLFAGYGPFDSGTSRQIRQALEKWLRVQIGHLFIEKKVQFAALATYFPDITSLDDDIAKMSQRSLIETILLAISFSKTTVGKPDDSPRVPALMASPIVEFVCGTRVDRCRCKRCMSKSRCFTIKDAHKQRLLVDRLKEVVRLVLKEDPTAQFKLALELEPGETYVVRDEETLISTLELIKSESVSLHDGSITPLTRYVGFNVDVSHMMCASVKASTIEKYLSLISHSHISDLPSMHSRDLVPLTWTLEECHPAFDLDEFSSYRPYLEVLSKAAVAAHAQSPSSPLVEVPFSGCCALELEGCGRIDWVHRGLTAMKQLFRSA